MRRLERAEGQIEKMYFFLQRGGTQDQVQEALVILKEAIDDAKVFIQQEPLGPGEINNY